MLYKPFMQIVPRAIDAVMKQAQRGTDAGGLRFRRKLCCCVVMQTHSVAKARFVCPSVHPSICLYACQTLAL